MYKVIKDIHCLSTNCSYFKNITVYFDLIGSSYNLGKHCCKRYFILCYGKAKLLLNNNDLEDTVSLSQNTIIALDSNIDVTLIDYTKTTKIICIQENGCA